MGNITHIQEYASTGTTYNTYYQYDSQNQLIREDNDRQGITEKPLRMTVWAIRLLTEAEWSLHGKQGASLQGW